MAPKRSESLHQKKVSSLNPLVHEHIPPAMLANLASYKYSGVDKSILSNYLMCHYWTFMVELLPMWLAPNLVTLIGFVISVSSTALVLCFDVVDGALFDGSLRGDVPHGEYPAWVWVYACVALFAYQTLDALDGKQARRTKSGSALGELFDHGCDAFITPLLQVNICIGLGFAAGSIQQFIFFITVTSGLLFAIWEQFVTGTLDFGYITGPTEGLLLTCSAFLLTASRGVAFWNVPSLPSSVVVDWSVPLHTMLANAYLSIPDVHIYIASWSDVMYYFILLAVALTAFTNTSHVIFTPRVASHPRGIALTSLLPNILVLALTIAYFRTFPSVVAQAPFLLESCYGFFASYTATRLTVSRLCVMPYRPMSVFYMATIGCMGGPLVASQLLGITIDSSVLIGLLAFLLVMGVVCYFHLIISVFRQFADHLDISIFKINKIKV